MKIFYALLLIIAFTACSKDESCVDSITGTYSGNCNTQAGPFPANLTVSKSSTGEFDLLITDTVLDFFPKTYSAKLSGDCSTLTITSQIVMLGGSLGTIYGIYELQGDSLTGNLYISKDFFNSTNSYHLARN